MTRRTRRELADYEWRIVRDSAETVACPWCGVAPREHCRNVDNGDELIAPAHWQRLKAALKAQTPGEPHAPSAPPAAP